MWFWYLMCYVYLLKYCVAATICSDKPIASHPIDKSFYVGLSFLTQGLVLQMLNHEDTCNLSMWRDSSTASSAPSMSREKKSILVLPAASTIEYNGKHCTFSLSFPCWQVKYYRFSWNETYDTRLISTHVLWISITQLHNALLVWSWKHESRCTSPKSSLFENCEFLELDTELLYCLVYCYAVDK